MKRPDNLQNSSKRQVIAFPARTPLIGGRQIHFLFSVRQVVDVLRHVDIQSTGQDSDDTGTIQWRGRQVPVLDLERRLGLRVSENGMPMRNIVVRSIVQTPQGGLQDLFAACCVGAASRQFELPLNCQPVIPPDHLPGIEYIEGMYVMAEYLFMVLNLGKMAGGMIPSVHREAVVHGQ